MTHELKNALLENNIQCINEYDGKFVFLYTKLAGLGSLRLPCLFSREIAVGSFFIANVEVNSSIKTTVYVCCNSSQDSQENVASENNLFWYQITANAPLIISPD